MSAPPPTLPQLIAQRAVSHWRLKLMLTSAWPLVFMAIYLGIQRLPTRDYATLPLTFIDRAVPFAPAWMWVYITEYFIIPLVTILAWRREQLWRLMLGIAVICVIAFPIFWLFPVACPRPDVDLAQTNFMYRWIVSVDTVGNAFPSLHVGVTALGAFFAARVIDEAYGRRLRFAIITGFWVWTLLIVYSIMATKQHYFVDGVAGLVLAYIGYVVAWWSAPKAESVKA